MPVSRELLNEPIPRLVRSLALPASTGYFFNTMYNVVDTWYAGSISTAALAALGLSFPIFFVIIAIASGLSTGISAVLANLIGAARHEEAARFANQTIAATTALSLLLVIPGWWLAREAFAWMGAEPEPARLASRYMTWMFAGAIFFNLNHVLNALLVARGDTTTYRNVLVAGVLMNVVLDPWMIHGGWGMPAFGFDGIAISTVLIQAASVCYLARVTAVRRVWAPWTAHSWRITRPVAVELFRQSGPAMLNMATIGIGILILTTFVNQYGTQAVAAYGLATRIEQIVLLPAIGLNMAVLAIAGQNHGAGLDKRVRETIIVALRFGLAVLLPGMLLLLVWPAKAMHLFTSDPDVLRIGTHYLRIAAFILYAYVLLFTLTAALQAVKQPLYAIWIGLYRQIVAPIAIILLLQRYTELGLWSVWISIAFTTWSAALYTVWHVRSAIPSHVTIIDDRR